MITITTINQSILQLILTSCKPATSPYIPKLIFAATNCSLKPLYKAVMSALQLLYKQIVACHNKPIFLWELNILAKPAQ